MKKMKLDDYFSFYEIVKALSALRVKVAASRHLYQLYWSHLKILDRNGRERLPEQIWPAEVTKLLPPRRTWKRGKKQTRLNRSNAKISELSIIRTVCGTHRAGRLSESSWGRELLMFCSKVQETIDSGRFAFNPPTLQLVRKNTGDDGRRRVYRCLSKFDRLLDRIIISRAATYLRDVFDSELKDCCYAFRKDAHRFSFHTAVENLVSYRRRYKGQVLYVADCDVQKFFDVINHDVILDAYDSFVQRLGPNAPDSRIRALLVAYLGTYSFPKNLEESQVEEIVSKRDCVDCVPQEVVSRLYHGLGSSELRLGIPQGGALSPLLANVVMDAADRVVLSDKDPDLFYARFCDDIIIVHPNKQKCTEALQCYLNVMKRLKLPIHELIQVTDSAAYFKAKSKGPVEWKNTQRDLPNANCTECDFPGTNWVNFLGLQIRYDGVVRIRKETISKHQDKLRQECSTLVQNLKKAKGIYRTHKNWKDLFREFQLHVVALGVGRVNCPINDSFSRSWFSVFRRHIDTNKAVEVQLRSLDRTRSDVFVKAKNVLRDTWRLISHSSTWEGSKDENDAFLDTVYAHGRRVWTTEPSGEGVSVNTDKKFAGDRGGADIDAFLALVTAQRDRWAANEANNRSSYLGAPFSYFGALHSLNRPDLANNNANNNNKKRIDSETDLEIYTKL